MFDLIPQLETVIPSALEGSVVETTGATAAVADLAAPVGAVVRIEPHTGTPIDGEVVGFRDAYALVYPFESIAGACRASTMFPRTSFSGRACPAR